MRKCPAGSVRPLTSPAAKPNEAVKAAVMAAPGSISNEPLLDAPLEEGAPGQAGASQPGGPSMAPAQHGLNGGTDQRQQAAGRRRSKRKAGQADIDAALQTLADVQAWGHPPACDWHACHAGMTAQAVLQNVSCPVSIIARK
jgi:hypothetical protein